MIAVSTTAAGFIQPSAAPRRQYVLWGAAVGTVASLGGIVVDDARARRVGEWKESTAVGPFIGDGYLTDDKVKGDPRTVTFQPEIAESGRYEVRFAYTSSLILFTR
jgi:hypothetical protein